MITKVTKTTTVTKVIIIKTIITATAEEIITVIKITIIKAITVITTAVIKVIIKTVI